MTNRRRGQQLDIFFLQRKGVEKLKIIHYSKRSTTTSIYDEKQCNNRKIPKRFHETG